MAGKTGRLHLNGVERKRRPSLPHKNAAGWAALQLFDGYACVGAISIN